MGTMYQILGAMPRTKLLKMLESNRHKLNMCLNRTRSFQSLCNQAERDINEILQDNPTYEPTQLLALIVTGKQIGRAHV